MANSLSYYHLYFINLQFLYSYESKLKTEYKSNRKLPKYKIKIIKNLLNFQIFIESYFVGSLVIIIYKISLKVVSTPILKLNQSWIIYLQGIGK